MFPRPGLKMSSGISEDFGPLILMMAMLPLPGGVAIAAIVSSFVIKYRFIRWINYHNSPWGAIMNNLSFDAGCLGLTGCVWIRSCRGI
jgi:hypothetical protein